MANITSRGQSAIEPPPAAARRLHGQSAMQVAYRQQPLGLAKGQSAMEFLMTYGWAILVLIIVITVLFYLGILNPKTVQPNVCYFSPGFTCYSFKISNGTGALVLDFGQALGKSILITNISCSGNSSAQLESLNNSVTVPSGDHRFIVGGDSGNAINCTDEAGNPLDSAQIGEKYQGRICISYSEVDSGINRVVCGDVNGRFDAISDWELGGGGISTPTPAPTGTIMQFCNENSTCDLGENCTCSDCDGQQDGCDSGYICNEGDCMLQPTPTPTPTPTPLSNIIASCPYTISAQGSYVLDADLNSTVTCITIDSEGNGSTLNCQNHNITGPSTEQYDKFGIYLNNAGGVTVQNCNIGNFGYGIYLNNGASGNYISGNNINANFLALGIDSRSSGNTISGNTISNNYFGITINYQSNNTVISGNTITSTYDTAIDIRGASNNANIMGNNISFNRRDALWIMTAYNNSVDGNTVTYNGGGIYIYTTDNNRVTGNTALNNGYGIYLNSATNIYVANNEAHANQDYGIGLSASSGNTVTHNNCDANNETGIHLWWSPWYGGGSNDNNVTYNSANLNGGITGGIGIEIDSSSGNLVMGNTANSNNGGGLWLHFATDNIITGNNFTADANHGGHLYQSTGNNFTGNAFGGVNADLYCSYADSNTDSGGNTCTQSKNNCAWLTCH